ncbi:PREDICTED: aquaporin-5-like [Thamnophis sirtalis]|uniref:Aquaporin-5-like n=1 Tax=Thamnophis sirtalis TaxID=35019 RepID=A0A6I9YSZ1_9SAUR|nr:PREDICTED: aquaporin-5-like [Thamnophis sirtalis]
MPPLPTIFRAFSLAREIVWDILTSKYSSPDSKIILRVTDRFLFGPTYTWLNPSLSLYKCMQHGPANLLPARGAYKFHVNTHSVSTAPAMATTERQAEILSPKFAWAILSEFVGTAIFLCIALGASFKWPMEQPNVLQISLAFGLTVATMVHIFGPISGAHINPAVTLAYFVGNQISIVRFVFYMILQVLGALAGTGIIYAVTPGEIRSTLFANHVPKEVTAGEAFVVELILTFSVVMCIFSVNDKRRRESRSYAALSIGLAVAMAHLIGIYYTGCSTNPARSFAPAVILGTFGPFHWFFIFRQAFRQIMLIRNGPYELL